MEGQPNALSFALSLQAQAPKHKKRGFRVLRFAFRDSLAHYHATMLNLLSKRLAVCALLCLPSVASADEFQSGANSSLSDAQLAIKQFKAPPEFKIDLFAAEPQVANPVAMSFDEQGRVYVAETERLETSVYDIRGHMNMFLDDLACRTVEDRAAMIHKFLGNRSGTLARADDRIQVLEDRSGAGRADYSAVFADGFDSIVEGVGAGVLARKGNVYYTDMPNLWLMRADAPLQRKSLSYGYGVHFNYAGHDLHGLRIGPDEKLYFSSGDRGFHVKTREGRILDYPDTGAVLRCNLDGSDLEVFAYGLRNPQDLAFDDHGNLFTGDNNCDHGDAARLVYVVEGGDSGWRIGNQISDTTPAGLWNSEKMWHLQFAGQAAYIVPPIAHIADGPSGLAHYPGAGFPEAYRDHFFLSDFRGSPVNSGVHSFAVKNNGAGFTMVDATHFFWGILATDCQFSPDGRLFVSDWVEGWKAGGQGRIYRLYDPDLVQTRAVLETKLLISEGMENRSVQALSELLSHPDQRVRQEAQFELAARGALGVKALEAVALKSTNPLARLHGVWGLGQLGARNLYDPLRLLPLLHDPDAEVRAQTAKILGDDRCSGASLELIGLLDDPAPRTRFFAAIALGKLKARAAVAPLMRMLRADAGQDVYLRHAGVMGLVGTAGAEELQGAAKDTSGAVRMAAVLAMRRLGSSDVGSFLADPDPLVVVEAARAISDTPIVQALPELAALIARPTQSKPLEWRVLNANFRLGGADNAAALANYAAQSPTPETMRVEALHFLETWADPSPRDRLTGLWRPLPRRDGTVAAGALGPVIASILTAASERVQIAAIEAVRQLGLKSAGAGLFEIAANRAAGASARVSALRVLAQFHDARLPEAVKIASTDANGEVRREGVALQVRIAPAEALATLASVLDNGTITEQQGALASLGTLPDAGADDLIARWLDKLQAGQTPKEVEFDLLAAADKRGSAIVKQKIQSLLASGPQIDGFAGFHGVLYGGDAAAGRRVFIEKPEAACTRCHKANGQGGDVGPSLDGLINRHDRAYILESILFPDRQIAPGYETVIVRLNNGSGVVGVLKSEDATSLVLNSADAGLIHVNKADIQSRRKGRSAMPEGFEKVLSKTELRNLVEFVATLK
jgi:quinoprotein glucose dehydrogenase